MFTLLAKHLIAPNVWRYSLSAPKIAAKRQAGHFLILRPLGRSDDGAWKRVLVFDEVDSARPGFGYAISNSVRELLDMPNDSRILI